MNILRKLCHAFPAAWQWYKGLYKGRKWYIKTLSAMCTLVVLFFLYLLMVNFNFLWLFGKSPSMSDVRPPRRSIRNIQCRRQTHRKILQRKPNARQLQRRERSLLECIG